MPKDHKPSTGSHAEHLVARFQIETEQKIAKVAADFGQQHNELLRKVAELDQSFRELAAREAELVKKIADAEDTVRRGVSEVSVALRHAVDLAEQAKQSAQVYEKLKDAEPALLDRINEVAKALGTAQDKVRELDNQQNELRGQVDRAVRRLDDVVIESASNTRMLESRHPLASSAGPAPGLVQVD